MNILYLASFKANHSNWNITYQDINGKRDIDGDMMDVDLTNYDVIIATPPCNYYSRANYRRETSEYSQKTKHLLPGIIDKLIELDKPFIVENVRSPNIYEEIGLFNKKCFVYIHGRHTYWTNIMFDPSNVKQENEYKLLVCKKLDNGKWLKSGQKFIGNMNDISSKNRQGGQNVHDVIEFWLQNVI
jgi:site-specific DNA-cytosine methylase